MTSCAGDQAKQGRPSPDGKGWYVRPWDSGLPVAVGWADRGVDEPHRHELMNEIYLVARGLHVRALACCRS
jgi:hypothetical protein